MTKRALAYVFAIFLCLLTAELLSRRFPLAPGESIFEPNAEFGWFHIPGSRRITDSHVIQINHMGLRDDEHSYEKPDDTFRLLVLGDSFAEALQVPFEETFVKRLEAELDARIEDQNVEVINGGVSGFGTGNELLWYLHEGRNYSPDAVLLLFFFNDIYDNYERPFYILSGDRIVINPDRQEIVRRTFPELFSPVWQYSYAYRNVLVTLKILRGVSFWGQNRSNIGMAYQVPLPGNVEKGWELTEKILSELAREVDGDGIPLLLMDIPSEDSLGREERCAGFDFSQVDNRLERISDSTGICWIPLRSTFRESHLRGERLYVEGDVHWNGAGQALAAFIVSASLADCIR